MDLPPCVVCGESTLDDSGRTPTLDEAKATEVLGRVPPRDLSVIDPRDDRRVWVGHENCSGVSLAGEEGSAEALKELLDRISLVEAEIRQQRDSGWHIDRAVALPPELLHYPELGVSPFPPADPDPLGDWRYQRGVPAARQEAAREAKAAERERQFQERRKKRLGLSSEPTDWDRYWHSD